MSAIRTGCPDCGAVYLAGVVGTTPWPAHVCATQKGWSHRCDPPVPACEETGWEWHDQPQPGLVELRSGKSPRMAAMMLDYPEGVAGEWRWHCSECGRTTSARG